MHVRDEKCVKFLTGNPEEKSPLGIFGYRWKYNIKSSRTRIRYDSVYWSTSAGNSSGPL
jgi:hypothetical protein